MPAARRPWLYPAMVVVAALIVVAFVWWQFGRGEGCLAGAVIVLGALIVGAYQGVTRRPTSDGSWTAGRIVGLLALLAMLAFLAMALLHKQTGWLPPF